MLTPKIRPEFYLAIFCYTNNLNLPFELSKWEIDKVGKKEEVEIKHVNTDGSNAEIMHSIFH